MISTLIKTVVVLGVLAVIGYDAFSMAATNLRIRDSAQDMVQAGDTAYVSAHSATAAIDAVLAAAKGSGYTVPRSGIHVTNDGTITITVIGHANTIAAHYIGPLDHFVNPRVVATARASDY